MDKLKPCPFCGEYPIIDHMNDSLFDFGVLTYWIVCPKCGIRTQRNRDKTKIFEAWNRRANDESGSD